MFEEKIPENSSHKTFMKLIYTN